MSDPSSLESRLADSLPQDVQLRVYHVSTPATVSPPILAAPPGQDDRSTLCESHFLGIASEASSTHDSTFVYAIEALIFTSNSITTIFVSKADSSGFISRLDAPKQSPSVVQTITETFLDYLLAARLGSSRVVLSLFARSQNQYLFPGSVENAEKHVLDDRKLIKWWCKILDGVWRSHDQPSSIEGKCHNIAAHVVVPGCDKSETKAFFPISSRTDSHAVPRWLNTFPAQFMAGDDTVPIRCLIPRLPDDPKSRFLDELDRDYVGPDGQWRSVKSLNQFWEMMSFRQECHAGRLVGFIWITFSAEGSDAQSGIRQLVNDSIPTTNESVATALLTPAHSFSEAPLQPNHTTTAGVDQKPMGVPDSPPYSSPARPDEASTAPRATVDVNADRQVSKMRPATTATNVEASRNSSVRAQDLGYPTLGEIALSSEQYEGLMDFLLQLDFAGLETAVQSTRDWIRKASELGSVASFGRIVIGRKPLAQAASRPEFATPSVNTLTGIRKKRKPEGEPLAADLASVEPKMHVLSSSFIRKKAKVDKAV